MHNVTLKLYWIYARARAAVQAKGHIQYCLVGSIDLPRHCHLKGPYYRDGVPIGTLLAFWVPIYISGSLFSVFWLHSCKEYQFSLHVYISELN